MTTILLVHGVPLWRDALSCLLGAEGELRVRTAEKGEVDAALREWLPEIIVVDLDSPDSVEVMDEIRSAQPAAGAGGALVVLARADRPGGLRRAFDAGALGYIDKFAPPENLAEVMRKIADGGRHIDEGLAFGLLQATQVPLSQRELSVLSLAAEGEPVASIAGRLHLTPGTVRNYLAAAIRKTGGRNRQDAIRLSSQFGWL